MKNKKKKNYCKCKKLFVMHSGRCIICNKIRKHKVINEEKFYED